MTRDERLETVEELSSTVTNSLGLREQLEVIRIINPLADTSTTESEFFIGRYSVLYYFTFLQCQRELEGNVK